MPSPTTILSSAASRLRPTLPRILASLPAPPPRTFPSASSSSDDPILVQPLEWQERFPNSFYRVYRSKIRIRSPGGKKEVLGRRGKAAEAEGQRENTSIEEEGEQEREEDLFAVSEGTEEGVNTAESEVAGSSSSSSSSSLSSATPVSGNGLDPSIKAYGKAWGVLFWNGKPKYPFRTEYNLEPTAVRRRYPHVKTDSLSPELASRPVSADQSQPTIPSLPTPYVPSTLIKPSLSAPHTSAAWRLVPTSSLEESTLEVVKAVHSGPRMDGMFGVRDWSVENLGTRRKDNLKRKMKERRGTR